MASYPEMNHLEGFWDPESWTNVKWGAYKKKKRNSFGKRFRDLIDQISHRLMGKYLPRSWWEKREKKQWPSSTGSYDPCADHYNWLRGAGQAEEAKALKEEAQRRNPKFLTWA